jgi:hypothetical protein
VLLDVIEVDEVLETEEVVVMLVLEVDIGPLLQNNFSLYV